MDEVRVRQIVRRMVEESIDEDHLGSEAKQDRLVTDSPSVRPLKGTRIRLAPGTERTAEIEELAARRGAEVVEEGPSGGSSDRRVAIGADHAGFPLKKSLKGYLTERGYQVDDCGTFSSDPVDYPDLAATVARKVASGEAWRGIVVDGAGIGSSIAANKIPGVRAALCYDLSTARNAREHNDANLLALGGRLIGEDLARQIVDAFLATAFAGGRHRRRVERITALERASAPAEVHPAGLRLPPAGD